jgi:glycerol-3-phosphate dehydrogenase
VRSVHSGLIPVGAGRAGRGARDHLAEHSRDGLRGLISVAGVKLTTAPTTARRVLHLASQALGRGRARAVKFARPLPGTEPGGEAASGEAATRYDPLEWSRRVLGTRASAVLSGCDEGEVPAGRLAFRCRARHAVRHEMAVRLGDVVFRSTDDAERGVLTDEQIEWAAGMMSGELAWSDERKASEIAAVRSRLDAMRPIPAAVRSRADT